MTFVLSLVSSINSPDVNKISDAEAAEEDSVEVGREINDGAGINCHII